MKFFEQYSLGDRVEVDAPTGGMTNFELGIMGGERGTVLDKRKGNWLDPVTQYVVEMDYPCEQVKVEISGRFLKNLPPQMSSRSRIRTSPSGRLLQPMSMNPCRPERNKWQLAYCYQPQDPRLNTKR